MSCMGIDGRAVSDAVDADMTMTVPPPLPVMPW